ncbi:MAG: uracil-DNA glycosylase [Nitrospiria bacterium]
MFNPWAQRCDSETDPKGHIMRRERFLAHLSGPYPRILLIGEAAGYQGCRFSGIPFTSERLLLEGKIPRIPRLEKRITRRLRPWSEPSATIVWNTLYELNLAEYAVLFNAVPWHPAGKKGAFSNRAPTSDEKAASIRYLKRFLNLYPGISIAALGVTAHAALDTLGRAHHRLRHPAYGGATAFRDGLRRMVKT